MAPADNLYQELAELEILQVMARVIRAEMGLKQDQTVIVNQRWTIPPDDRLYVSLKISGSRPYAVNRRYRPALQGAGPTQQTPVLNEEVTANLQDLVTLNVYSQGDAARLRRNEVILALASTRMEQAMEAKSFSIGQVPVSFTDVSEGEGTDRINRFAISFMVLWAQAKTQPVTFYDQFTVGKTVLQP